MNHDDLSPDRHEPTETTQVDGAYGIASDSGWLITLPDLRQTLGFLPFGSGEQELGGGWHTCRDRQWLRCESETLPDVLEYVSMRNVPTQPHYTLTNPALHEAAPDSYPLEVDKDDYYEMDEGISRSYSRPTELVACKHVVEFTNWVAIEGVTHETFDHDLVRRWQPNLIASLRNHEALHPFLPGRLGGLRGAVCDKLESNSQRFHSGYCKGPGRNDYEPKSGPEISCRIWLGDFGTVVAQPKNRKGKRGPERFVSVTLSLGEVPRSVQANSLGEAVKLFDEQVSEWVEHFEAIADCSLCPTCKGSGLDPEVAARN